MSCTPGVKHGTSMFLQLLIVYNSEMSIKVNPKQIYHSMTSPSFVFTELANTVKYGGGFIYNLVFTEWRHCVLQNEVWERGCYITLFSSSDVIAFHIINIFLHIWSKILKKIWKLNQWCFYLYRYKCAYSRLVDSILYVYLQIDGARYCLVDGILYVYL